MAALCAEAALDLAALDLAFSSVWLLRVEFLLFFLHIRCVHGHAVPWPLSLDLLPPLAFSLMVNRACVSVTCL